jgi:hypothetical protein
MQRIAGGAQQPAPVHGVVVLQPSDGRLHCLAALEPSALLLRQAQEPAPVDDLNAGVGRIHASEAQVHNDLLGLGAGVLGQDAGLLRLLVQRVAVVDRCR